MTRTRNKSQEKQLNIFVDHLDRERLIMLDHQFEGLQLTPSESSHLMDLFNQVPQPGHGVPRGDPPMDPKLFESTSQNTQDHVKQTYRSTRKGPAVKACPVDPKH
ncbi:unnamed protein product [Arabis nemorensis]|uniref:Uncharacterized protein n=1 Tax=Arabis nemorensis TaxID=586526 RepID=A0A565CNF9_9BRAS|nr:unnamed protein product [Arabis nemorensis]